MKVGKIEKVIRIPLEEPKPNTRPQTQPVTRPKREEPILVPNWPVKTPAPVEK